MSLVLFLMIRSVYVKVPRELVLCKDRISTGLIPPTGSRNNNSDAYILVLILKDFAVRTRPCFSKKFADYCILTLSIGLSLLLSNTKKHYHECVFISCYQRHLQLCEKIQITENLYSKAHNGWGFFITLERHLSVCLSDMHTLSYQLSSSCVHDKAHC